MWAWIVRLVGGWLPLGTKPFGEYLGKIIWAVGIILMVSLATNIWDKLFPGKPDVVNVAGDYNAEQKDAAGIGCNLWKAYIKAGVR